LGRSAGFHHGCPEEFQDERENVAALSNASSPSVSPKKITISSAGEVNIVPIMESAGFHDEGSEKEIPDP